MQCRKIHYEGQSAAMCLLSPQLFDIVIDTAMTTMNQDTADDEENIETEDEKISVLNLLLI